MADPIPLVDYLVLGGDPHLVAQECARCSARFFDRRNACASCGGAEFRSVALPREGTVHTFSIVSVAAPGVPVPFVAAIVDCGGTRVRGCLVNLEPRPENVTLGMRVRLTTRPLGADSAGTEAVGYGFEPAVRQAEGPR
ncbi:putative nucleic-acid-binding protein containing a Zn-ribbon [Frankia sp. EI5c]|uniref:Zn-ribbon domain-containing OB-fold protein n=1 Tax=Frankia sp. EI5c TaxID=683316 RepID=UPI0007C38CF0|nr:OB-fold domain-containing protein [Frankia sp. EI5c]OAA21743.1 putative nucleic-acid-binding protein containing a Zn-ribbon [Frankia sp. EI5c]